jgi:hypothetical protein
MSNEAQRGDGFLTVTPAGGDMWADPIGRLILNFGAAELVVNLLLMQWSSDALVVEELFAGPLARRISLLERLAKREDLLAERRTEFDHAIETLKRYARTRNAVAHNALILAWKTPDRSGTPDCIGVPDLRKAQSDPDGLAPIVGKSDLIKALDETAEAVSTLRSFVRETPEISLWLTDR